jgi:NhaP-type Na+/H+ or K+/H+ antiporter
MLTLALLLTGAALLVMAFAQRPLVPLPVTPAMLYLLLGAGAGALFGAPGDFQLQQAAPALQVLLELALLVSLFAVGLRLRSAPGWRSWRVALVLAGPAMLVSIALAAAVAVVLFGWSWPMALLLGAILAPTDPVLASDVQVVSEHDRDALRVSLTAEGALNDGTALPVVLAALWLLQHDVRDAGVDEVAALLWPVGGGAFVGIGAGWLLGLAIRARVRRGDPLLRDELLTAGGVALSYGLALATQTSSFVVAFLLAVTLLQPLRRDPVTPSESPLAERLHAFGARIERLAEALSVLAVGVGLSMVAWSVPLLLFALACAFVVRPLSVLSVLWPLRMPPHQRHLIAWFGIRGVGSLYYLAHALAHGVSGTMAAQLLDVTLATVAASILLHGLSVTRAMQAYRARGGRAS